MSREEGYFRHHEEAAKQGSGNNVLQGWRTCLAVLRGLEEEKAVVQEAREENEILGQNCSWWWMTSPMVRPWEQGGGWRRGKGHWSEEVSCRDKTQGGWVIQWTRKSSTLAARLGLEEKLQASDVLEAACTGSWEPNVKFSVLWSGC